MSSTYQVTVGGEIGLVHEGDDYSVAGGYYDFYVMNSKGFMMHLKGKDPRAVGQSVELTKDGKVIEEFTPQLKVNQ